MIKMIFSDMDGTLLDSSGAMPSDFAEVMAMLKERNILFVPASGRQYTAILKQMPQYENDFAFIAENGAVAVYKGETLLASPIEKDAIRHLLERTVKDETVYPVLCGEKRAFVESKWEPHLDELTKFLTEHQIVDDIFAALEQERVIKIAFGDCLYGQAEERLLPIIENAADEGLKVMLSSNYWVDVLNEGTNKGTAIKGLQQKLGIKPEECIAFGDYVNDIEMLQSVGYGYAMANAHPEVIKVAKYFAPANNKNGVMQTIRELIKTGQI